MVLAARTMCMSSHNIKAEVVKMTKIGPKKGHKCRFSRFSLSIYFLTNRCADQYHVTLINIVNVGYWGDKKALPLGGAHTHLGPCATNQ